MMTSLGNKIYFLSLLYYPYGEARFDQKVGSFDERHKYTGYEFDATTGLNYAGARYQTPKYGRFISQDPVFWKLSPELLFDPQQMNSYSYARNNPIRNTDPKGLSSNSIVDNVKKALNTFVSSVKSMFHVEISQNNQSKQPDNTNKAIYSITQISSFSESGFSIVGFQGSNFTGDPVVASSNFVDGLIEINQAAYNNNVMVNVTDGHIRNAFEKVSGAIVQQSDMSNHYTGSAIDMNVISNKTGQNCNSKCLGTNSMSPDVKGFIGDISSSPNLRWGGEWSGSDYDPVHIDNGFNINNFEGWKSEFQAIQGVPYVSSF